MSVVKKFVVHGGHGGEAVCGDLALVLGDVRDSAFAHAALQVAEELLRVGLVSAFEKFRCLQHDRDCYLVVSVDGHRVDPSVDGQVRSTPDLTPTCLSGEERGGTGRASPVSSEKGAPALWPCGVACFSLELVHEYVSCVSWRCAEDGACRRTGELVPERRLPGGGECGSVRLDQ